MLMLAWAVYRAAGVAVGLIVGYFAGYTAGFLFGPGRIAAGVASVAALTVVLAADYRLFRAAVGLIVGRLDTQPPEEAGGVVKILTGVVVHPPNGGTSAPNPPGPAGRGVLEQGRETRKPRPDPTQGAWTGGESVSVEGMNNDGSVDEDHWAGGPV